MARSTGSRIRTPRRRFFTGAALAMPLVAPLAMSIAVSLAVSLATPGTAAAQTAAPSFPNQPIRLIVPFAPGGTTDLLGRLVADGLRDKLGQPVVVENKGGAGGNIGSADVARAAADGYTLLMATPGPMAINQYAYAKMPFDAEKQLMAISNVASVPNVLIASPQSGIQSMADLLARAKAAPGKLTFGSAGIGSTSHLAGELLKQMGQVEMTHVPYKGVAPAKADLLGGQIDVMFDNLPTALPMIESGKVVALGVSVPARVPSIKDVPTIAETLPGYALDSWFGIVAPAGTPAPVARRIAETIAEFVRQPDTRDKIAKMGATPVGSMPDAFAAEVARERTKFKTLVEQAKIRVE